MKRTAKLALITFVVVVVASVSIAAILGFFNAGVEEFNSPEDIEVDNPQFSADRVTANETPGNATIQMDSDEESKKVVVSTGLFVREHEIQPLVNALVEEGHEVVIHNPDPQGLPRVPGGIPISTQIGPPGPGPGPGGQQPPLGTRLEDAHGFVSVGVSSYQARDIASIRQFANNSGRVLLAVNPAQQYDLSKSTTNLFSSLGVNPESGYVYNMEENDLNYQRIFVEPTGDSDLTEGIDRAMLSTASPVNSATEEVLMRPTEGAQNSLTRAATDAPVMARNGSTAIIGDTEFMLPENTQRADNDVLVGNIADFLVTGERTIEEESPGSGQAELVMVGPDGDPSFEPQILEIEPGTVVRFEWDSDGHNIIPVSQPNGTSWEGVPQPQEAGNVHEHTFEAEGTYEYISESGEEMFGIIVVGDG